MEKFIENKDINMNNILFKKISDFLTPVINNNYSHTSKIYINKLQ